MDLIAISNHLKGVPDQALPSVLQSGTAPGFLVTAEMERRKKMRQSYQQAQSKPTTVAEDLSASMGQGAPMRPSMQGPMQQQAGLGAGLPPQQPVAPAPQTPPGFACGGLIRGYADGGMIGEEEVPNYFLQQAGLAAAPQESAPLGGYAPQPFSPAVASGRPADLAPAYRDKTVMQYAMENMPKQAPQVEAPEDQYPRALAAAKQFDTPDRFAPLAQKIIEIEKKYAPKTGKQRFTEGLITAGLQMAASRRPDWMGAIGEAGLGAIGADRAGQQQEQELARGLLGARSGIAKAQAEGDTARADRAMQVYHNIHGAGITNTQMQGAFNNERLRSVLDAAKADSANENADENRTLRRTIAENTEETRKARIAENERMALAKLPIAKQMADAAMLRAQKSGTGKASGSGSAQAAGGLNPEAQRLLAVGAMSGMSIPARWTPQLTQVWNEAALLATKDGLSPQDAIATITAAKSTNKAYQAVASQYHKLKPFVDMAEKNADVLEEVAKLQTDTGSSLLNVPIRSIQKGMGGMDITKFGVALLTARAELTRALNSANGSGVITDHARAEVEKALGQGDTAAQIKAALDVFRQEIGNRNVAYENQLRALAKGASYRSPEAPPQGTPPPAQGAPSQAPAPAGPKMLVFDPATGTLK